MGLVIKRDVFCSERLAWIVDAIILIMIPPLSGAIGREDDEKVKCKDTKQNPQTAHDSDVSPRKNVA